MGECVYSRINSGDSKQEGGQRLGSQEKKCVIHAEAVHKMKIHFLKDVF